MHLGGVNILFWLSHCFYFLSSVKKNTMYVCLTTRINVISQINSYKHYKHSVLSKSCFLLKVFLNSNVSILFFYIYLATQFKSPATHMWVATQSLGKTALESLRIIV